MSLKWLQNFTRSYRVKRQTRHFRPDALGKLEQREVPAAVLPAGFTDSVLVSGLNHPDSLEVASDGRIFVAEPTGAIRIFKNGTLLTDPFAVLPVANAGQGLIGVTLDPNFAVNHYVYAYYVADYQPGFYVNRLIRLTADGDKAVPGSIKLLLDTTKFPLPPGEPVHDGASIHFGGDGKLYISTGDLANGKLAQQLNNPFGKILRINSDGTIPRDNPFYNRTKGVNRAIWALGLRNPFTFAVQPGTGLMYINDVGNATWEEINVGSKGANYGWPLYEGPSKKAHYVSPIFAYTHASQTNPSDVAITGGVFYNPVSSSFPASYVNKYFFEDFANGWIHVFDPTTRTAQNFASGLPNGIVDLDVDPNGDLYYIDIYKCTIHEISCKPN